MRERLTREQAIQEHRKMWTWIAEQYRNGSKEDVYLLKRRYIEKHTSYAEIWNYCFCCEYITGKNGCRSCPIDFGKVGSCLSSENSPYKKLFDYNLYRREDSNYMADLALKVATLPEREEKEDDA